jgi:exonuclease III
MTLTSYDDFQVLHINIRSISRNFNELLSFIQKQNIIYHVILITETWLTELDGDLYHIPSYSHISVSRVNKRGGGIRLYYLDEFVVNPCNLISGIFESHEALFVKLSLKNQLSLTIGCIYRPPSASIQRFNEYLSTNLFADNQLRGKCIIMGDFNIDSLKFRNSVSFRNFENLMGENGYRMLINSPTRCSPRSGIPTSILDHAWVNFHRDISAAVIDYLIADHLPIKIKIKINLQKKLSFRMLSDNQFAIFDQDKRNLFDQYIISSNNVNLEVIKLEAWIQKTLDI